MNHYAPDCLHTGKSSVQLYWVSWKGIKLGRSALVGIFKEKIVILIPFQMIYMF